MKELLQRKRDLRNRIDALRNELFAFDKKQEQFREQIREAEFDYRIVLDQITEAEAQERNAARLAAGVRRGAGEVHSVDAVSRSARAGTTAAAATRRGVFDDATATASADSKQ